MGFSKEYIKSKVGSYKCPQGKCVEVAKEMVEKILGGPFCLISNIECQDLTEVLAKIENFLTNENLIVIWPGSGFRADGSPVWHSYIVFNANPLRSFAAWESGIEFYGEEETKQVIENTVNSSKHNKVITIHLYTKKET